jgi:CTP synthase
VESARHVMGLPKADSAEFSDKTPDPIIDLMAHQRGVKDKGGTMRLGAYPTKLAPGTLAQRVYGANDISERHRHRYEVNNDYVERLKQAKMTISGQSPDGKLVEMIELSDHPYFLGCQFHPEFKSRPLTPHPLFSHFIGAAREHQKQKR